MQEYLQSRRQALPNYEVATVRGEAHQQTFYVNCNVPVLKAATRGQGGSRRAAEQDAASLALEQLEQEADTNGG